MLCLLTPVMKFPGRAGFRQIRQRGGCMRYDRSQGHLKYKARCLEESPVKLVPNDGKVDEQHL